MVKEGAACCFEAVPLAKDGRVGLSLSQGFVLGVDVGHPSFEAAFMAGLHFLSICALFLKDPHFFPHLA